MPYNALVKTDEIDAICDQNGSLTKQIKNQLKLMDTDIKSSTSEHPSEPETKIKQTVHRIFSTKFKEVLKTN